MAGRCCCIRLRARSRSGERGRVGQDGLAVLGDDQRGGLPLDGGGHGPLGIGGLLAGWGVGRGDVEGGLAVLDVGDGLGSSGADGAALPGDDFAAGVGGGGGGGAGGGEGDSQVLVADAGDGARGFDRRIGGGVGRAAGEMRVGEEDSPFQCFEHAPGTGLFGLQCVTHRVSSFPINRPAAWSAHFSPGKSAKFAAEHPPSELDLSRQSGAFPREPARSAGPWLLCFHQAFFRWIPLRNNEHPQRRITECCEVTLRRSAENGQ